MSKDSRLYAKFTLDFPDSHKVMPLSDAAFRCLVEATLWSRKHLTDGFLARRYAVARWSLGVLEELATNDPRNPSLIEVNEDCEGWLIHDFAAHQDTREDIEARIERNKRAGQAGGLAKAKRSAKQVASEVLSENLAETETEKHKRTSRIEDPLPPRDDVESICKALVDAMVGNGCRKPAITKRWREDARLLLDRDGISLDVVLVVLAWSQLDDFWKTNIHSPGKLRAKFDALQLQMQRNGVRLPATESAISDWLRDCWTNCNTKAVSDRCGLGYFPPDIPDGVTDLKAWHREMQREWITANRDVIIARILERESA